MGEAGQALALRDCWPKEAGLRQGDHSSPTL